MIVSRFTTLILTAVALSACAATLTERGKAVDYVTKQEAPANCKELGEVDFGALEGATSITDTKVRMRNKTAEMGGNFLVIDYVEVNQDGNRKWYTGSGRAYTCE